MNGSMQSLTQVFSLGPLPCIYLLDIAEYFVAYTFLFYKNKVYKHIMVQDL